MPHHSATPLFTDATHSYDSAPLLVYWEMTGACDLACRHCRAEADAFRDPLELSTSEGKRLCEEIARFSDHAGSAHGRAPRLVMTGGDPLKREDLSELIAYARSLGIDVSVTPAAGPNFGEGSIRGLHEAGTSSIALSLDGSNAHRHDSLRGVPGTFDRTIAAIRTAESVGMPVQINTLVAGSTVDDLQGIYELLATLKIERWALFFLISTGRGAMLEEITPTQTESVLSWVCELAEHGNQPFVVKATEAHHVRRISYQRFHALGAEEAKFRRSQLARGLGIRDGNGIVFVSRRGEVFPSGFLPINLGNVRTGSLVTIYRDHPMMQSLRDPDGFHGKCGRCAYRVICGGSRARAYAATGDPLESDPLCLYPTIRFETGFQRASAPA